MIIQGLKEELKEYETMLEKKDNMILDLQKSIESLKNDIGDMESDHQQRRKKAQELILEKDKEIDKLKQSKKKIDEQYKSMKKAFDQISHPNQTSQVTRAEDISEFKSEIPKEFFDESSSSENSANISKNMMSPTTIPDTVIVSQNKNALDKAISYQLEEQYKEKITSLNTKITDLENLVKYHMTREQDMIDKVNDLQRCKTRESVNVEYVKNVFVSYLEYKAMKNDKEAKTCEQVLYTALRLSPNEIKDIDRFRKKYKNYKFWKYLPQSSKSKSKKEKELQMMISKTTRIHEEDIKKENDDKSML